MFEPFLRSRTLSENALVQKLHQKKIISEERVNQLWKKYQHNNQQILNTLKGILVYMDYASGVLHIQSYPDLKSLTQIEIHTPEEPPSAIEPRDLVLIDTYKGNYNNTYTIKAKPGLLITDKGSFIYDQDFETRPQLAVSHTLVDGPCLKDSSREHFDLYYSHLHQWLCVFHRQSGMLHLLSLETYERLAQVPLIDGSSTKALNIGFMPTEPTLYITDNTTPTLNILEYIQGEARLKTWRSGLGTLGNFWLTPDGQHAYLSVIAPKLQLLYFDLKPLKAEYSLDIKGESCAQKGFLPQDLLIVTPENKYLAYMTYLPEKDNLPIVQIIRTDKIRTVRRYSVKEQAQPDLLAYALNHPYHQLVNLDLKTLLISEKEIDADRFNTLQEELSTEAAPLQPTQAKAPKTTALYKAPPPPKDIWKCIDQDAEPIELPPEAEHVIVELFIWQFYQATLTNLRIHQSEVFKLKKMAGKVRKALQTKEAVLFKVPALLGQYAFEAPISRAEVLALLNQKSPEELQLDLTFCPVCEATLPPVAQSCEHCDYSFDTPEAKAWRKQSSFIGGSELSPGHMLVLNDQRIIALNAWRKVLFVLEGKPPWFKELSSAVSLPNGNVLITDGPNKKIGEYTVQGKMVRKLRGMFQNPLYATAYNTEGDLHYLVIDETKVLELNAKHQEIRKFPSLKTPANLRLKAPSQVQVLPNRNWLIVDPGYHRVLETTPEGQVDCVFGPEQDIKEPVFAHRLSDGTTVIVDASDHSIHRVGAEQKRMDFWPLSGHPEAQEPPESYSILHNEDLLLSGPGYVCALNIKQGQIRWFTPLPKDLSARQNVFLLQKLKGDRSLEQQEQISEYAKTLSEFEMFLGQSEKRLSNLAEYLTPVSIKKDEVFLKELTRSNAIFFVTSGRLDLIEQKTKATVLSLKKGDVLGAVAMMYSESELKVRISVEAKESTEVLQLNRSNLKKVLVRLPIIFQVLRKLAIERRKQIRGYQDEETRKMTEELTLKIVKSKMKRHPLFKGASEAFLESLSPALNAVAYMPDQTIFSRGESGGTMFFVNEGQVGLLRKGEHIPEILLESGNIFGEMSLITDQRRNATMITTDYCRFYTLEKEDFDPLVQEHPWFAQKLQDVAEERRQANEDNQSEFAKKMGILRADLPQTDCWSPLDLREDKLTYFASPIMNMVMGVENSGEILWCLGQEPGCDLFQPYRMHLEQDFLFVADTGNERVLQLGLNPRKVVKAWNPKNTDLSQPRSAVITPHQQLLIADTGNSRLLMIDEEGEVLWELGAPHEIMSPFYAEMSTDNHILFADQELHMVYEVDLDGEVLWSFGKVLIAGDGPGELDSPSFVQKLPNGDCLIADTGNDRVLIVGKNGVEKAVYYGTPEFPLTRPKHCVVRENGDILVFLEKDENIIRLDHWGDPIWAIQFKPSTASAEATAEVPWVLDESILEEDTTEEPSDLLDTPKENLVPWSVQVENELWDQDLDEDIDLNDTVILNLADRRAASPIAPTPFDALNDDDYLTTTLVLNKGGDAAGDALGDEAEEEL